MQCAPYLENLDVKKVSVENTAIAAERVAREKIMTQGAIASRRAAELYGLDILDAGINFDKNNVTRFVILSKKRQYTENANKISISFSLLHESGTLYNILSHFLYNDLNLSHIESVPLPDQQWEYRFYDDGYEVVGKNEKSRVKYDNVGRLIDMSGMYVIVERGNVVRYFMKDDAVQGNSTELAGFLTEKCHLPMEQLTVR